MMFTYERSSKERDRNILLTLGTLDTSPSGSEASIAFPGPLPPLLGPRLLPVPVAVADAERTRRRRSRPPTQEPSKVGETFC